MALNRILLVEDSEADIGLIRIAFSEKDFHCSLETAHNGVEALDYLRHRSTHDAAVMPELILLDLNMPQMDGKQFLAMMRDDDKLGDIPVIMLTSSDAAVDIQECYELNANGYIVKPGGFKDFVAMAHKVRDFLEKTRAKAAYP